MVRNRRGDVAPGLDSAPCTPPRTPPPSEEVSRFPATTVQRGMIIDSVRAAVPGVDVIQIVLTRPGSVDRDRFDSCWQAAVLRHDILRSTFHWSRLRGVDRHVHGSLHAAVAWVDLDPGTSVDDQVEAFLRADRISRFDLATGPLFRVSVLSGPSAEQTIVATFHHAIVDGRSLVVLFDEVFGQYEAQRKDGNGRARSRPDLPPFQAYVHWWENQDRSAAHAFWKDYLSDLPQGRPLAGLLTEPAADRSDPATVQACLTSAESARVRAGAAAAGVATSALVHTAWGLVMARHTCVQDVVFAVTRSCRWGSVQGAQHMVGPLINTVPLRLRLDPAQTVRRVLRDARERALENREHQLAPLADVLEWAGQPADGSRIDSLVVFERATLQARLHEIHPVLRDVRVRILRRLSFPLALYVFDEPEILLNLMFDRARFDPAAADEVLCQFRHVLVTLAGDQSARVGDIGLEPAGESRARAGVVDSTPPAMDTRDATIPLMFAAQVRTRPDAPALTADGTTLTYAELDRRSDELARVLRKRGVVAESVCAVAIPRSAELVVTLLAIVKAGGAYLPLDPDNPPDRTRSILVQAGAILLVTTTLGATYLPPLDISRIHIDDPALARELVAGSDPVEPLPACHSLGIAYISFTSGSTGTPKGVAVPHRGVARLVHRPNFATLGPGEVLLHLAPAAFDATTFEVWGALLTGARLVVAPPGPFDLAELAAVIRNGAITTLWLTAGLFSQLVELDVGALAGVRQVLAGGEVLSPDSVRAALRARPGWPLVNAYGPTENTTFTTCHRMDDASSVPDRVPIGRPVQQTTVYVLDEHLAPLPIGVTGELYTGGDGVARGYVGRPAHTAGRFVPDPFGAQPGARLYRTGDLVRWRTPDVLEFVGRVDDQVKIRGHRVEPGEVEAVLRKCAGVHEAIVLARGTGLSRHLIAFVMPHHTAAGAALVPHAVREHARHALPPALVPTSVVLLDRLPLLANGKVDRSALSETEPPTEDPPRTATTRESRTRTELRLATLWAEALPAPQGTAVAGSADDIFDGDDFFAIGGNSLGAIRLAFRISEEFGIEFGVREFYAASTLAACARAVDTAVSRAAAIGPETSDNGITRRDRRAFRIDPTSIRPTGELTNDPTKPAHLVRLSDDWALWSSFCLRSAGFPIDLLDELADPIIAASADLANADPAEQAAFLATFPAATRRLSSAIAAAGRDSRLREAVAWQNRHALRTGIDPLLSGTPASAPRNKRQRQHEALLAGYLQRYCAKNDTIGFFGPTRWGGVVESGSFLTVRHAEAELSARTAYLEGWAVVGLLQRFEADLRPDLRPRRLPHLDVVEGRLLVPLASPVPLSSIEQAVLAACDGRRTARQIAKSIADSAGHPDAVYTALTALAADRRISWRLEVPPGDVHGERTIRELLVAAHPSPARSGALAALDELEHARDVLAAAAGEDDAVEAAIADLEKVYVRHTGTPPVRRPGEIYAGRTIAYEECTLGSSITVGGGLLDGIRDALGIVLDGARWFTAATAALYSRLLRGVFDARALDLGGTTVPFSEIWLLATDLLFEPADDVIRPLTRALARRWAAVIEPTSPTDRIVQLHSADLLPAARRAFDVAGPGWPTAVHHSPDLMLLAEDEAAAHRGDVDWVLGELHPGINTLRYQALVSQHDAPETLRGAMAADLRGPAVWTAPTAERGGVPARQHNSLASADDRWLVFAADSFGVGPGRALLPGTLDVVLVGETLRVRSRDGRVDLGLIEVLGDVIAGAMIQHFRILPRDAAHTPRVRIDRLVVCRESWSFPAAELAFAQIGDEARRYREIRAWAGRHGMPRRLFLRTAGEPKPIYLDLAGLASADLLCRAVRRVMRVAGPTARIAVTEMLPEPERLWLTDVAGRRHTAELRLVAVDQRNRS